MGMLSAIADLELWVMMDTPEAQENLVLDALKSAFRQFCKDTGIWTEEIAVTTVADQESYTLTVVTTDAIADRIEIVQYDDRADPEDKDTYYFGLSDRKLYFETDYIPSAAALVITVTVNLSPQWRASTFPAWILERYGKRIAHQAASELLDLPGKPWTNEKLAQKRHSQYLDAVNEAVSEKKRKGSKRVIGIEA